MAGGYQRITKDFDINWDGRYPVSLAPLGNMTNIGEIDDDTLTPDERYATAKKIAQVLIEQSVTDGDANPDDVAARLIVPDEVLKYDITDRQIMILCKAPDNEAIRKRIAQRDK